jgi:hypothetical protein
MRQGCRGRTVLETRMYFALLLLHSSSTCQPTTDLEQPDAPIASSIRSSLVIHPSVKEPQPKRNKRSSKATRSAREITRVVASQFLLRFPDPLCDDLTDAGTTVVQSSGNAHGDDGRHVASHPRAQWA